jgi:hypothetical protein
MGGVGIAARSNRYVNVLNPASVTARDSLSFMSDLGLNGRISVFEENGKHAANTVFNIDDFVISISAASDELADYYIANQVQINSPLSLVTTYTNIEGGYGLFSSRTQIERVAKLSANTKRELYGMTSWGFKEH